MLQLIVLIRKKSIFDNIFLPVRSQELSKMDKEATNMCKKAQTEVRKSPLDRDAGSKERMEESITEKEDDTTEKVNTKHHESCTVNAFIKICIMGIRSLFS